MTKFESHLWLSDEEILLRGIPPESVENYRRHIYQQAFSVSTWYKAIQEHTFRSEMISIDRETIRVMLKCNHALANDRSEVSLKKRLLKENHEKATALKHLEKKSSLEKRNSWGSNSERTSMDRSSLEKDDAWLDVLTEEESYLIYELEARLDSVLSSFPNGGFIKLDTRSPKDVVIDRTDDQKNTSKMGTLVRALMQESVDKRPTPPNLKDEQEKEAYIEWLRNESLVAFSKASIYMLHVKTGREAMDLLRKSARVTQDLSKMVGFGEAFISDSSIVVREWHEEVSQNPQMEFRGFVYKNQLNAVSQYDDITYCETIAKNKGEIEHPIRSFFDLQIKDKLTSHENYVIDFFVDFGSKTVKVIELNPFHIGAGPALFSWKEHRELFMNGPFEFRVVEKVNGDEALQKLPVYWEKMLRNYVEDLLGDFPIKGKVCSLM
jgi:hypothetical protein